VAAGGPALLGPPSRSRDLALALIVSRVVAPQSKLSTLSWWADTTLGVDLDVSGASTDQIYAAMDWLADGQDVIEKKLAAKHLGPATNPRRMAQFDLTSSWITGAGQPMRGGTRPQHVGVGDAGAQLLRGDVEKLDFVGGGHDRVGHRLVLGDAGDCFDSVVEAVDVLHVERGDHIDTGG
jgi:hypothetical protein